MKRIIGLLLVGFSILNGCMVGGKYSSQANRADSTAVYPHSENKDSLVLVKWFDLYKDEAISKIIKVALDSNRNLLGAIARV